MLIVTILVLVIVLALAWLVLGTAAYEPNPKTVDRAQVVGAAAGIISLLSLATLIRHRSNRSEGASRLGWLDPDTCVQALFEVELASCREAVNERRISAPEPIVVTWAWDEDRSSAPEDLKYRYAPSTDQDGGISSVSPLFAAGGVVSRLWPELYARLPYGRLAIVGDAGSGKSSALLLLLDSALRFRESLPDTSPLLALPIPVNLALAAWKPSKDALRTWIIDAVLTKLIDVPGDVSASTVGHLLDTNRMALFFDGLDEAESQVRNALFASLHSELPNAPVVLSSRFEHFDDAVREQPIDHVATIQLRPLDLEAAVDYLRRNQPMARRRLWKSLGAQLLLSPRSVAAASLTNPLALVLTRSAYRRSDPLELLDTSRFPSIESVQQHLFARMICEAYPDSNYRRAAVLLFGAIASRRDVKVSIGWWSVNVLANRRLFILAYCVVGAALGGLVGWLVTLVPGTVYVPAFALVVGVLLGTAIASLVGFIAYDQVEPFLPEAKPLSPHSAFTRTIQIIFSTISRGTKLSVVFSGFAAGTAALTLRSAAVSSDIITIVASVVFSSTLILVAGVWVGIAWGGFVVVPFTVLGLNSSVSPDRSGSESSYKAQVALISSYGTVAGLSTTGAIGIAIAASVFVAQFDARSMIVVFGDPTVSAQEAFLNDRTLPLQFLGSGLAFGCTMAVVACLLARTTLLPARLILRRQAGILVNFHEFFGDAHRKGLLYKDGSGFLFRHAALEDLMKRPDVAEVVEGAV